MTDWILSGVPRAGTSLSSRLLGKLDDVVALSEPLQLTDFGEEDDVETAAALIQRRFQEIRTEILRDNIAPSLQEKGALSDHRVERPVDATGLRRPLARPGTIRISKPLSENFHLVIKQNAVFAALLHRLKQQFSCIGLVRNPVAVLTSWQTVDLPVNRGRLPGATRFDADLAARLASEEDVVERQLLILDWFFSRFTHCLPPDRILRYEDIIDSGGRLLADTLGIAGYVPETLERAEADAHYPDIAIEVLCERVLQFDGAWRDLYTVEECRGFTRG